MIIEQAMDNLVQIIEKKGFEVQKFLAPGLSRAQIEDHIGLQQLHIPDEYFQLYRWHNGINTDLNEMMLFGEHDFISFDEVLIEYQAIQDYYYVPDEEREINLRLCLPFASYMGATLSIYCSPNPFFGLQHPVISIYHDISILFENLEKGIITATEWYRQGVYDKSPVDERQKHMIHQKLNARIPYRSTTL